MSENTTRMMMVAATLGALSSKTMSAIQDMRVVRKTALQEQVSTRPQVCSLHGAMALLTWRGKDIEVWLDGGTKGWGFGATERASGHTDGGGSKKNVFEVECPEQVFRRGRRPEVDNQSSSSSHYAVRL